MSDKVQLIKEEILRRKQSWQHSDKQYEHGGKDVCDYLLGFINSLPEEPASEDLEEEMIRWHKEHFGNKRDWGKTSGEYLTRKSQLDIAHHFAEWQKQKDMQDFLEKAEKWIEDNFSISEGMSGYWVANNFKNYIQKEKEDK